MFTLSPKGTSLSKVVSNLSVLVDSPVKELSFTCNEKLSKILPSAVTRSPASSKRISPGTTSFAAISCFSPSLKTFAAGADKDFRASNDFSALTCWTVPKIAFKIKTTIITAVLSKLPVNAEITAATIKMMTIKSLNCSKKTSKILFFLPSIKAFGPTCANFS